MEHLRIRTISNILGDFQGNKFQTNKQINSQKINEKSHLKELAND